MAQTLLCHSIIIIRFHGITWDFLGYVSRILSFRDAIYTNIITGKDEAQVP